VSLATNSPRTAGRASNGKIVRQNIVCIGKASKRQPELAECDRQEQTDCIELRSAGTFQRRVEQVEKRRGSRPLYLYLMSKYSSRMSNHEGSSLKGCAQHHLLHRQDPRSQGEILRV
jgi:hypothetical protein